MSVGYQDIFQIFTGFQDFRDNPVSVRKVELRIQDGGIFFTVNDYGRHSKAAVVAEKGFCCQLTRPCVLTLTSIDGTSQKYFIYFCKGDRPVALTLFKTKA